MVIVGIRSPYQWCAVAGSTTGCRELPSSRLDHIFSREGSGVVGGTVEVAGVQKLTTHQTSQSTQDIPRDDLHHRLDG